MLAAFAGEGLNVIGAACDVADGDAVRQWTAAMAQQLGGIDIVVANVSAIAGAPDEDSWRAALEVDMLGTVRTVEAAMPHLEAIRGCGDRHRIEHGGRRELRRGQAL